MLGKRQFIWRILEEKDKISIAQILLPWLYSITFLQVGTAPGEWDGICFWVDWQRIAPLEVLPRLQNRFNALRKTCWLHWLQYLDWSMDRKITQKSQWPSTCAACVPQLKHKNLIMSPATDSQYDLGQFPVHASPLWNKNAATYVSVWKREMLQNKITPLHLALVKQTKMPNEILLSPVNEGWEDKIVNLWIN